MSSIDPGYPTHPGVRLRSRLSNMKRSNAEIARLLGVSRQTLHELLAQRQGMTANMALRVAKLTATKPEFWMNAQAAYDLMLARRAAGDSLKSVPTLEEAW